MTGQGLTVFQLARMRRIALQGLYIQLCAGPTGNDAASHAAGQMSRERLVAAVCDRQPLPRRTPRQVTP